MAEKIYAEMKGWSSCLRPTKAYRLHRCLLFHRSDQDQRRRRAPVIEPSTPRMSSRPTWVPIERAALLRNPSHMELERPAAGEEGREGDGSAAGTAAALASARFFRSS